MEIRKIVTSTIIYGIADSLVVLVGGLLLLPLYTNTLSKHDFGSYIAVKTNIELLTYVIHFGLLAAVSRLYFDFNAEGEGRAYIVSVALWFPLQLCAIATVLAVAGRWLWHSLTPEVDAWPYLAFALAIATANFYFTLATTVLRAQQKATWFIAVQLAVAATLLVAAFTLLAGLKLGLAGLMWALLASSLCGSLALPFVLGSGARLRIDPAHVSASLRYAAPIVAGLLAYFVLNRANILILQRYVAVGDLALYGLAQQLSLIIAIGSAAFAKALQPALFAAPEESLARLLSSSMQIFVIAMSCLASLVCLFAIDIVRVAAPRSYGGSLDILLILVVGAFAYSLTIGSDTAVLRHRRPSASAAIATLGAALSGVLGLVLIPRFGLDGAAFALLAASIAITLVANSLAFRITGFTNLRPILLGLAAVAGTAITARCVHGAGMSGSLDFAIRVTIAFVIVGGHGVAVRTIIRREV